MNRLITMLSVLCNISCNICGGTMVDNGRTYVCQRCGNES